MSGTRQIFVRELYWVLGLGAVTWRLKSEANAILFGCSVPALPAPISWPTLDRPSDLVAYVGFALLTVLVGALYDEILTLSVSAAVFFTALPAAICQFERPETLGVSFAYLVGENFIACWIPLVALLYLGRLTKKVINKDEHQPFGAALDPSRKRVRIEVFNDG